MEVNVYAIVNDRDGRIVSDLAKSDFSLREDGAPQEIGYFSRESSVPLSIGVLIDTSPSQGGLLKREQDAAKLFLSSALHSEDQAFVIHFDIDVEVLQDFTNASRLLTHALDEMRINEPGQSVLPGAAPNAHPGATRLYDAVYLASNELMKTRYGRKVLVLVTDGEDQGSKIDLKASLEAAQKADVIVYAIVIRDPDFYLVSGLSYHGSTKMEKLSLATGGSAIRVDSARNVGAAFDQIATELREEYRLGYSPTNVSHSGNFRRIELGVRGHGYTVRARRGYYTLAHQ
jgi:VWFA-related protein